jgi:hypothetical protein
MLFCGNVFPSFFNSNKSLYVFSVGVIVHLNLYMEIDIKYTVNSNKIYLYYFLRMRPRFIIFRLKVENLSSRVSWQDLKDLLRRGGDVTFAEAHTVSTSERS